MYARSAQSESGDPRFENQLKSEIAFRDSYQTSFFVAARTAIKGEVLECTPKMLFEVGREGPDRYYAATCGGNPLLHRQPVGG